MTRPWLKRRFTHTCVIERDSGTAQTSTGEITAAWAEVESNVPCRFAEKEEVFASENLGLITRTKNLLMLRSDQDVQVEDRVHSIVDGDGNTIGAGTYAIDRMLIRRDLQGNAHHASATLERVDTR